jgi:transposase
MKPTKLPVLGIDVGKKTCSVHFFVDPDGVSHRGGFANSPRGWQQLHTWLRRWEAGPVHVCLEATGVYGEGLARFLYGAEHTVSVVNPLRVHAYARAELKRNKTDALDASVIARFCHAQRPAPWEPLAQERQQLQDLVRHLQGLRQRRLEERNRLESATGRAAAVGTSLRKLIRQLEQEIAAFQKRITEHLRGFPELWRERKLLTSIPGIGKWTAVRLLAEIPHLARFPGVRQVVAYAGLNPALRQSGTSLHGPTHLSKLGNAEVRAMLYLPALVALRRNPRITALRQRLREKQKHHLLIMGAAMRKLLHLAYGVLHSGKPFDPSYPAG